MHPACQNLSTQDKDSFKGYISMNDCSLQPLKNKIIKEKNHRNSNTKISNKSTTHKHLGIFVSYNIFHI